MAVSSVLAPNGKTYTFEHPDGASQEDLFKFVHQSSQVKPKAQATKPGVVENVARGVAAGAAQSAYDTLNVIGQEIVGISALKEKAKFAFDSWAGNPGAEGTSLEDIEKRKRKNQAAVQKYVGDTGDLSGKAFGVDEGRLSADVGRGIGQIPLMVLTKGASSIPMAMTEVRKDAEETFGTKYADMSDEQRDKVRAAQGVYSAFSLVANRVGLKGMGLGKLDDFLKGGKKIKGSVVIQVLKDQAKGGGTEFATEFSEAAAMDQIARLYDPDREYSFQDVIDYGYEGLVGGIVGTTVATGTSVVKNIGSETSGTKKSDLKKEVEDRPALEVPRTVQIEYKELDGQVRVFPLAVTEGQDPMAAAEEELAGRYDPAFGLTVTDQSQPVGPEQELDLPDQAPDATQEDVPVQPEAAVPTPEQAPVEQVLPEVVPQVVPATEQAPEAAPEQEQAPAVRGNFRISPRMAKSKPRYRGQPVAYGSELELAVYMATAKGKNASKVRSELIEAGYSPAEINAMSEEVRAQMKKGYNPNSKKPISVAIAQDVTAEAAGVDRRTMSFKDVTKRTPEIQEQAKILRENIKAGDREQSRAVAQAADEFKPVQSYDFVPAPESNSEMRNALSKDKVNKLNAPVKDGAPVAVRLDIPAYVSTGTWVPVVHEQTSSFRPGTPMSYQATAVVDGATLGIVSDIAVSGIAAGKAKSTIATIKGNLKKVTPTQAKKMADKALKDPSYVQVGMDPERRGYFYNRETMQEVVAGDQAIQIGPLVLVKNPQYGATPSNEWLSLGPDVVAEAAPLKAKAKKAKKVTRTGEQQGESQVGQGDVTAQATDTEVEDRGPQDTFDNGGQVMDFVESTFDAVADKIGIAIRPAMGVNYVARYNATQQVIEYNPMALLNRSKSGVKAAMREEIIHAAMHNVLMQQQRKTGRSRNPGDVWVDFFETFAKTLTAEERVDIGDVYQSLTTYHALGAEYSRAVVQNLLYGEFSEQYQMQSKGGPAWDAIVQLLRSVQAYMAKVLGPMRKTNPEAAQVIVDSVELLKAADPSIRPKSQDVVAQAYDATDKNTAKENTEAGERVGKDSSERIREERKWFDGASRKTASKYLTPVITRLNRIHPMFGRILQNLDTAIRTRSFKYRKQTEMFFNKLNAAKGAEFQELKQLIFFSPTPEEANLPSNKAKMQRRDALLHKHGLLNMYRLDVQPILEEIYTEYSALGMPKIGYLEDYFPRVIKDLEGLIKSYGHKTKRTFEVLVREENIRRSELKDKDGNPAPLPEMQESELGRFFQDFLQGKFRVDLNGVKLPGNVKAREIQLIPEDKLKFYDEPGVAFGKYTTNMARAIESFKVVGDIKKGEGRLLGSLGKLTEELFTAGEIDQVDANEVKSLTELITSQFQAENEILKSLGTLTYMVTLINPGPVLVQIMDLYKVALYRGLGGVVSGTYRTVTGNRRFDIEEDFSIAKTQLSAEFEDPSVLQKALDFGLSRLVPFRQMDTAMKHASIEAAYDDFVKKSKAPVGSKKYQQLLDELTITMGREDALKTISDLRLDKAMESPLVKEALLAELLQRQPLTYLQVPEGYQTDPSKRLFYKLSTFMLLDLNYNRQEFMNDLGGPGKTLKQRTVALRRLAYMATLLTMFGLPSDLLDDWISGKDTYIPEHVMNNMLGMFGLSRYTTSRALNKGAVESVIQRFTPPAINIMIDGEQSLRSWVKGDKELFEIKSWRNSPLSDVWYYRTGGGVESQRKYQKKQRKEGITPTFDR